MTYAAQIDTFAREHLPPPEQFPDLLLDMPDFQYPPRLNCAVELLDRAIDKGWGNNVAVFGEGIRWTYTDLLKKVNQCANVLVNEMALVPGSRILLRGPNNPMLALIWLAVAKAGLIAVTTMPLLRAKELTENIDRAEISAALCDSRFADELQGVKSRFLQRILYYGDGAWDGLEARMAAQPTEFSAVDTAADDTVIIAFTSGTTGNPKATMHFHRDVIAISDAFPRSILNMQPSDINLGSPPLGFTFGLGGLLLFPLRYGAATLLLEKYTPESYLQAIAQYRATVSWTSPFFYRKMSENAAAYDISSLRKCVSAGEALPIAIRDMWRNATGIELIDGIGATEMLHIFISHTEEAVRPGATGKPIPGYQVAILDDQGNEVPPGTVGRLAVKGITGCRYLSDSRQINYVQNGWNITGDAYLMDEGGYFFFQARNDDIIITTGYNIAGPEVENALIMHPAVAECVVVGAPDVERGTIVKAYIVLRAGYQGDGALVKELQDYVKNTIAPYKYPRAVEFIPELPRTQTGKVQRYVLRDKAWAEGKGS